MVLSVVVFLMIIVLFFLDIKIKKNNNKQKSMKRNKKKKWWDIARGYSLIGKTSILHIVNLGSTPTVSNVKLIVSFYNVWLKL